MLTAVPLIRQSEMVIDGRNRIGYLVITEDRQGFVYAIYDSGVVNILLFYEGQIFYLEQQNCPDPGLKEQFLRSNILREVSLALQVMYHGQTYSAGIELKDVCL